jgi:NB-ARC domain
MSTVRAAFNISATIVKSLVKVAGFGFVADAIEGGQELYQLACSLKDETFGSAEAQMSGALRNSITDELASIEDQLGRSGRDEKSIDLFIGRLETSTKRTIARLLDDDNALCKSITEAKTFHAYVLKQSTQVRADYTPGERKYLDSLLHCVAREYLILAPKSPNYNKAVLKATVEELSKILTALEELKDGQQELKDGQQQLKSSFESLRTTIENEHTIRHNKQLNNAVWGSRPHSLKHWIERNPTSGSITLLDAIFASDTSDEATLCVLIGPAGSGKTRLAASIADRCQNDKWNLVAWINAESDEVIKNQVIAISEEKFGLQLKPNEDPEIQLNRALSTFPSQNDENILLILDNVENSQSLDILLPRTPNVHVIVTTRHGGNWSYQQGWLPFNLSTFSREESIQLLTLATQDDDKATANLIAQLLDDLPLAVGRAANTCTWLKINNLRLYYSMLEAYPAEKVLDSTVATRDRTGVVSALQLACLSAVERIGEPQIRDHAERILRALCYLSEFGVPVCWLKDETNLFSMCAYTELIDSSLVEETTDSKTATIHRLQAYAMRMSWRAIEPEIIADSILTILTRQLDQLPSSEETLDNQEQTRYLIEQIRAMSDQTYSHFLFDSPLFQKCLAQTLTHAIRFELSEAITLSHTVLLIGKRKSAQRNSFNAEDGTHVGGDKLICELIELIEQIVTSTGKLWGHTYSEVLEAREMIAQSYIAAGMWDEALLRYEKLVSDCEVSLAESHPVTMEFRKGLATCRQKLEQREADSVTE